MGFRVFLLGIAALFAWTQAAASNPPAFQSDEFRAALESFRRASGVGVSFEESHQHQLYRQAEQARTAGQPERAGQILAGMTEGYWAALGYLNLATDYARTDLDPARALVALRVALAMAENDSQTARRDHLRNNLLVRAGYLAYRHGEFDKAIGFLKQVDLDSFVTPRALYVHGLALASKGNHRAAMQSWHRARKYPLAYPGVADAWIGMGRGYDLSGYLGQAGEAYLAANAAFEGERVTLRKLAGKIRDKGAYQALVLDARETGVDWFLADSRTLTQPRMAYLLGFMTHPEAQHAVGRVAELAALQRTLQGFDRDLSVFQGALAEQLSSGSGRQSADRISELASRGHALLARVEGLAQDPVDAKGLSAIRETLQGANGRLASLRNRAEVRPEAFEALRRQAVELQQRNRVLLGSVSQLLARAEDALDARALDYVQRQDRQMTYALDKTEQQIAHLYEYLALENLGEERP